MVLFVCTSDIQIKSDFCQQLDNIIRLCRHFRKCLAYQKKLALVGTLIRGVQQSGAVSWVLSD